MKVMILESLTDLSQNQKPLVLTTLPDPVPGPGEVLLKEQRALRGPNF